MSYQATVFKVMIAAPSDVDEERLIAREVIYDWNDVHSEDEQVVLIPVDWKSHSYPKTGERPQEIINAQVLQGCDLLVAVFWTRLGTPTGGAKSGTVEEIEKHEAAGKPVMIYFSNASLRPSELDKDQHQALEGFKKQRTDKGLYETYEDALDFEKKFQKHLSQMIINDEYFETAQSSGLPEDPLAEQPLSHKLSTQAETLIREVAQDEKGTILRIDRSRGIEIRTNGKRFLEADPKARAVLQAAFSQLLTHELIEQVKGSSLSPNLFRITAKGFEVAEELNT